MKDLPTTADKMMDFEDIKVNRTALNRYDVTNHDGKIKF